MRTVRAVYKALYLYSMFGFQMLHNLPLGISKRVKEGKVTFHLTESEITEATNARVEQNFFAHKNAVLGQGNFLLSVLDVNAECLY